MTWTHDSLAADLAAHLRGNSNVVTWEDMQLGPAGSPRPDVFAMEKTFTSLRTVAYEVKVTRADAQRDFGADKWKTYRNYARVVVLAIPAGLLKLDEIPTGLGVMVRGDVGWKMTRRAVPNDVSMPTRAWQKLLFDGIERAIVRARPREASEWRTMQAIRRRHGDDLANTIARRDELADAIEDQERYLETLKTRTKDATSELSRIDTELRCDREAARLLCHYRTLSGLDNADFSEACSWAYTILSKARAALEAIEALEKPTAQ